MSFKFIIMEFKKEDLEGFKMFDPRNGDKKSLPDCAGSYAILLRKNSSMPESGAEYTPSMVTFGGQEYELIYVGISNKSLRERDYKQHFTGNNAGHSTLRKSLGSLMNLEKTFRSEGEKDKVNPKTKFVDADEIRLSEWMENNLLLLYKEKLNPDELEEAMIKVLNPPLNIKNNQNIENKAFRSCLSEMRKWKR